MSWSADKQYEKENPNRLYHTSGMFEEEQCSLSLSVFFSPSFLLCQETRGARMYVFVGSKAAIWSHKPPLKAPTQCPTHRSQEKRRAFPDNCRRLIKSSGVPLNLHALLSANNCLLNSKEKKMHDVYSNTWHLTHSYIVVRFLSKSLQLESGKCKFLSK